MNRRDLLKKSSLAAVGSAAAVALGTPTKAHALVNVDTSVFASSATLHTIAGGNVLMKHNHPQDWFNVAASNQQLLTFWLNHRLDDVLRPGYNRMTESRFNILNVNVDAIWAGVKVYNPYCTHAQVYDAIQNLFTATTHNGLDLKTNVLNYIRVNGIAPYIRQSIVQANINGGYISNLPVPRLGPQPPGVLPPPLKPNPYALAGGGEQGCQYSAWGLLGLGLAVGVITLLTDGADLMYAATWYTIQMWGGRALMGWSATHAVLCGVA